MYLIDLIVHSPLVCGITSNPEASKGDLMYGRVLAYVYDRRLSVQCNLRPSCKQNLETWNDLDRRYQKVFFGDQLHRLSPGLLSGGVSCNSIQGPTLRIGLSAVAVKCI